jgi:hypothetical protein
MTGSDPIGEGLQRHQGAAPDGAEAVDAQTRQMAQQAGLDRDMGSQVPPLYGRFSILMIAGLALLGLLTLLWIFL